MQDMEGYDEPDPDSDYDYEDTYAKKRKRRSGKNSRGGVSDSPMRRGIKVLIFSLHHRLIIQHIDMLAFKEISSVNVARPEFFVSAYCRLQKQ